MNLDLIVFLVLIAFTTGADLVAHRKGGKPSMADAIGWTLVWVVVSLAFAAYLYWSHGTNMAVQFVSGWSLELSLSVDNLFAIMAVFAWFAVSGHARHKLLHWGIIGAIVFRLICVLGGSYLMNMAWWVALIFAAFILFTAIKMVTVKESEDEDLSNHPAVKLVKKFFPVSNTPVGDNLFVRMGKLYATPLFVCLVVIELSDIMFSMDSVPAVLSVSKDLLIVYASMMFAIMLLRSLYFVLEAAKDCLHHLEKAVFVLLVFIAAKLALGAFGFEVNNIASLAFIVVVLATGVIASLLTQEK